MSMRTPKEAAGTRSRTIVPITRTAVPRAALAAALLALAGLAACGGPARSKPGTAHATQPANAPDPQETPGPDAPEPDAPMRDAVVEGGGTAATPGEAYEQAVALLEDQVYGDNAWARELGLTVHDRAHDLLHEEPADGGVRVLVGLERERLDGVLQELASQPLPATVPPALAEALAEPYGMYMEVFACERRLALLDQPCEAPSRQDIATALQTLASEIRLRARLADGVPLDGQGRPLRPLEVVVERVSARGAITPLPDLPVMVVQPDGADAVSATEARTDAAGVARFAFRDGATWPDGLRVALDPAAFIGPLAEMWPGGELEVQARPAGMKRWGVVVTERVQGNPAREPIFAASLDRAVRTGGGEPMFLVPVEVARRIAAAGPAVVSQMLPALADELQGRLDVLVVAEVDSEYASRMGAYRVWYEARGRVRVFDTWTGKRLAELEDAVTATGVGDERADQAARGQLAEKLAGELAKVPAVVR